MKAEFNIVQFRHDLHADQVENALKDLGCVKVNLQILKENDSVQEFYQKLGYSTEERISMGKEIPENIN